MLTGGNWVLRARRVDWFRYMESHVILHPTASYPSCTSRDYTIHFCPHFSRQAFISVGYIHLIWRNEILPEILRAAKILKGMQVAHAASKGAVGLEGEMIDAPMLKQVLFHLYDIESGVNYSTLLGGKHNSSRDGCRFGNSFNYSVTYIYIRSSCTSMCSISV